MSASERFCAAYSQYREQRGGTSLGLAPKVWLQHLQDKAAENFASQGLPQPQAENWKYTRLDQFQELDFIPGDQSEPSKDKLKASELPVCPGSIRLVFVDGRYNARLSSPAPSQKGLTLCSFAKAVQESPELLAPLLGSIAPNQGHPFAALNTMFMTDGVFLRLAENTRLEAPIHCLFISTSADRPVFFSPRLLLVAGEQSEATLIEHYLAVESLTGAAEVQGGHVFTNALTEIFLGRKARIRHYKLQAESTDNTSHIAGIHVEQLQGSSFFSHNLSLGAGLARNDITVRLAEQQAECRLYGAYCIGGSQHVDFHTQIDHVESSCYSRELYKGVVQDRARAVFNGMVVVHSDAQQSDAQLMNKNLLLSAKAEVDTKPELQIYADDVKCSHGATVGQLDPAALFYLQSRGIPEKEAQAMLVAAFMNEILQPIEPTGIQQLLNPEVRERMNTLIGSPSFG